MTCSTAILKYADDAPPPSSYSPTWITPGRSSFAQVGVSNPPLPSHPVYAMSRARINVEIVLTRPSNSLASGSVSLAARISTS